MSGEFPCDPVIRTQPSHCWGSIPGQAAKILQAIQQSQKKEKELNKNKIIPDQFYENKIKK